MADEHTKDGNWFASTMIQLEDAAEMETVGPTGDSRAELDSSDYVTLEQPGRYTLLDKHALYEKSRHQEAVDDEEAELARGGMGRLLLTFDNHLGRDIAVKELLPPPGGAGHPATAGYGGGPSKAQTNELVSRFLREARVTGQLEHPSIVPVYELGEREDGTLYYTMKLVRGRTLHEAIHSSETLEDRLRLLAHVRDLAFAISYAHSRGVINRDIKPQNIMVGEFGETVVLDWGLAKVLGRDDIRGREIVRNIEMAEDDSGAQTVALFLGTPNYMPPEQAWGRLDDVDERSDVWAIGAVLYELLTGRPPYSAGNALMTVCAVREDVAPAVESLEPAAPRELATVAMRCLQREQGQRYETARDVALEIERYQAGGRVAAYEYSSWELLKRFVVRNKALSAAVGVAVATLVVATVLVWGQYRKAVDSEHRARISEGEARVSAEEALHSAGEAESARTVAEGARDEARNKEQEARAAQALADRRREEANTERLRAIEAEDETRGHLAEAFVQKSLYASEQRLIDRSAAYSAEALKLRERPDARGRLLAFLSDESAPRMVGALPPAPADVTALAISADGAWLASGSRDGTVVLWSVGRRVEKATIAAHASAVTALAFGNTPLQLYSGGDDGESSRWTLAGRQLCRAQARVGRVEGLLAGTDGGTFVVGQRGLATVARGGQDVESSLPGGFADLGRWLAGASVNGGKMLAVVGERGGIEVREMRSQRVVFRVAGHSAAVQSVDYSPDGKLVATAGADGGVALWKADGREQVGWIDAHADKALVVRFSPDGKRLASGGKDGLVRIWGLTGEMLSGFDPGFGEVYSVAWSPDGARLGIAGRSGGAWVVDARGGAMLTPLVGHKGRVFTIAFSHDGGLVATAGEDGHVRVWDVTSGEQKAAHREHDGPAYCVAFSPNGELLASAGADGALVNWNLTAQAVHNKLTGHTRSVQGVAFSPDGRQLASASYDKSVRLWDTASGEQLAILQGHTQRVSSVAFSPDGAVLASGGGDRTVRFWHVGKAGTPAMVATHQGKVYSVDFSADGRFMATGGEDGRARLWNVGTGDQAFDLPGHQGKVFSVRFSPDGRKVATAGSDRTVRLWDTGDGKLSGTLAGNAGYTWLVRFSPDGRTLASCGSENLVRLWDIDSRVEKLTIEGASGKVWSLAFSPDGALVAAGDGAGRVTIWNTAPGKVLESLEGYGGVVLSLAWSRGGALATGDSTETVRLWSKDKSAPPQEFNGGSGMVYSLDFSPDGRTLASAGAMGIVHLWDTIAGREQARIEREGESRSVQSVRFTPTGARLAAAHEDGQVRFIDLAGLYTPPEQLARQGLAAYSLVLDGISLAPDPVMTLSRLTTMQR